MSTQARLLIEITDPIAVATNVGSAELIVGSYLGIATENDFELFDFIASALMASRKVMP